MSNNGYIVFGVACFFKDVLRILGREVLLRGWGCGFGGWLVGWMDGWMVRRE